MQRIMGIDPGSCYTGWGIIDAGQQLSLVEADRISLVSYDWLQRLAYLYAELKQVILQYQPQVIAIEQVFMAHNVASALKLGQARGVAIAAAGISGGDMFEYAPRQIKKSITGYGQADKEQMKWMVCSLLKTKNQFSADAADALAVALCHAFHQPLQRYVVRAAICEKNKLASRITKRKADSNVG